MKYRHCDGKLVLKITDDVEVHSITFGPLNLYHVFHLSFFLPLLRSVNAQRSQCLKFATNQQRDLKKLDRLNGQIMLAMASGERMSLQ